MTVSHQTRKDPIASLMFVAIITYGQVAFDDLVNNESFRVLNLDPNSPEVVTSVEVTDHQGCQFALSIHQCRTFFVGAILKILHEPLADFKIGVEAVDQDPLLCQLTRFF